MSKEKIAGLMINGRLKKSGVTFYTRNGQMVARTAHSNQPQSRTRGQFVARQQLAHSCRLWTTLKWAGEPTFATEQSPYSRFRSMMRRTPVVFLPSTGRLSNATLLLPGMPVSVRRKIWRYFSASSWGMVRIERLNTDTISFFELT